MMRKPKSFQWVVLGTALVLLFAPPIYWFSSQWYWRSYVSPPKSFRHSEYTKFYGEPYREFSRDREGASFQIVYGQMPSSYLFVHASGHPAYVFDDNGKMVDWSSDVGDDNAFISKWFSK
jgi:hypothetical protein